jgi:hypothetical protein
MVVSANLGVGFTAASLDALIPNASVQDRWLLRFRQAFSYTDLSTCRVHFLAAFVQIVERCAMGGIRLFYAIFLLLVVTAVAVADESKTATASVVAPPPPKAKVDAVT